MDTQTRLTVAAIVGPLVGVALGALLASRFQQSHWFRDRRLDAFVAAKTSVYIVIAAAVTAAKYHPPQPRDTIHKQISLGHATDLRVAVTQWGEASERLELLAGASVLNAYAELRELVRAMVAAGNNNDPAGMDTRVELATTLRNRLAVEMRKELKT